MSSLAVGYLTQLIEHPVRTKALTSGSLNALSELIAGVITGEKDPSTGSYIGPRVGNTALYGLLVSGPLSHYLVDILQKAFRKRKTGPVTNILQIVAMNLFVTPIMAVSYITFMSVLAGSRSIKEIKERIHASIMRVLKSQWITSPLIIALAQKYVPKLAWTPFFSFFAFILTTYQNIIIRKRFASQKKRD